MSDKRTYADRRDYLIVAVAKRSKRLRKKAVECKGGKRMLYGYDRCLNALDLHNIDANQ